MAGERRHEHEQCGFRQMEIREQPVDDAKPKSRGDEQRGLGLAGRNLPLLVRGRLERAQRRRADGNDTAATGTRRGHGGGGLGRDPVPLAVHPVRGQIVALHRRKRAGAHVQRHPGDGDTRRAQRREHRLVEVQSGGRRGDGAGMAGIDSLVARLVGGVRSAPDVRRQRDLAVAIEILGERARSVDGEPEEAVVAREHGRRHAAGQVDRAAGPRRMARAELEYALVRAEHALQQQFDGAAGGLDRAQSRLDHPRVVEDDEIAGGQETGQVAERAILDRVAVDMQQAAFRARRRRRLGDERLRQREVEIGQPIGAHG